MRKQILRLLEKGKELQEQLISADDESIPVVISEGIKIAEVMIPEKVNGILAILNASVKMKKYQPVTNLQQAIELFSSSEIQEDINKAIANMELVGLSDCEDCFITIHEILEAGKRDVQLLVEELNYHATQCRTLQL